MRIPVLRPGVGARQCRVRQQRLWSEWQERIQCNIRDITGRKKIEEALRILSGADGVNRLGDGLDHTVMSKQRIVLFNAAAEKMFRCSQADALGQPLERFIPDCFRAAHSATTGNWKSVPPNRDMGDLISLWALRADGEKLR